MSDIYAFLLTLPVGVFMAFSLFTGAYIGWNLGRSYQRQRHEEGF